MKGFVSLFKTPLAKVIAFVLLLGTSILIALAMLLGNEAGQFVIRVRNDSLEKSIAVTLDYQDPATYSSVLHADGMTGFSDYSAEYFIKLSYKDLNAMTAKSGPYQEKDNENNRSLYGYTFYIVNTTEDGSNVGVDIKMTYSGVSKNVDKAIRVMTYATSSSGETPKIYMHTGEDPKYYVDECKYVIEPFYFEEEDAASGTVFSGGNGLTKQHYTIGTTASQQSQSIDYLKYSVFFWLEGNDPQCNEDIFGGTIKFDLEVSISM